MLRKKLLSIVVVVLVMTVASVLLAARSFGRRVETAPSPATSSLSVPVQEQQSESDQKGMWLRIGPDGFVVKEWTVSAGEYFIVIQNATGLKELSLTIDRQQGERVQEIQLPGTRRLWKQKLQLARGTYLVGETSHPEWTTRITVE